MKFAYTRATTDWVKTVEINNLKQLINFMEQQGHAIIIEKNFLKGDLGEDHPANNCDYNITVYDGYVE